MDIYIGVGNSDVEELVWSEEESGKWFDNQMHDKVDELGIYMDEFEDADFEADELEQIDELVDGNEYPELKNALSIAKSRNTLLRIHS